MEQLVSAEVSPTLDDVAREFSLWRETRQHRGRIPASEYRGAHITTIDHETLSPGTRCPECQRGNLIDCSGRSQYHIS